jgi:hypothetical protein
MVRYDVLMQIICLPKIGLYWFVLMCCVVNVLLVQAGLSDVSLLFFLSEVLFGKGVILIYMAFIKVFFVLKFRCCTSLLNSCLVLSSHIAIFLLCCLCYHFHVICSEYVSLLCCMPCSCLLNWIWDDCLVVKHITGGQCT